MYDDGYMRIERDGKQGQFIKVTRLSDGVSARTKITRGLFTAFYTAIGGNDEYGSCGWGFNFDSFIGTQEHFDVFKPFKKKFGWMEQYENWYEASLDKWATNRWGEDWASYGDYENIVQKFDDWWEQQQDEY